MPTYSLEPRDVAPVESRYRRIRTKLPVPESIPLLQRLQAAEPIAMQGQPPILWDSAEGFLVRDKWGNQWIDWSSGVLITNAGHGDRRIIEAIRKVIDSKLLTTYCFPNEERLALVERIRDLLPAPLEKVFLLTTGSETVECAIKLCRTHGVKVGGAAKNVIVSYRNAFHGRTLGSQQAGGIPSLKSWIGNLDPGFLQIPFPDGYRCEDTSFDLFERSLAEAGIAPASVAGVILETYQGGDAAFAPPAYMQRLREWCDRHAVLLVCDEVQAGFGRTGTLWGFEHYDIIPDLTCFGKGISSSLPLAAVAGRADIMDLHPAGSMTSTHSGNPVCCAAALAGINAILEDGMVDNAREVGARLQSGLQQIAADAAEVAAVLGKGMVAGFVVVDPSTGEPDARLAFEIVRRAVEKGVLMFSPVGFGGGTVKIAPPLMLTHDALDDSLEAFRESVAESVAARREERSPVRA